MIKCADWVIDLGPEAGDAGWYIVGMGTPEDVVSGRARVRATYARERSSKNRVAQSELEDGAPARPHEGPPGATIDEAIPVVAPHSSPFVCHTAVALQPVLAAGPREERQRYDPREHAARELAVAQAGFGRVGREVKMPWQIDGRKWHLAQRTSREGQPRRWEPEALEYVIDLVQAAGAFAPADWSERASVEVTAPGAPTWFLHALTGGEWLLELYFYVPPKTFKWRELDAQLGLKTLDEREDLETYGDWSRVDVRPRRGGLDAVVVYVHDKAEIDTPTFRKFIKHAVRSYLEGIRGRA